MLLSRALSARLGTLGLRHELVRAQREKLRRLYHKGRTSAEVLRAVDR
ncbi:hypothetical protein [Actinoallomurus rhizosphaericola]|nr:hypothetical protein [Actinoallomurus rhizosphaericola]MCO5995719.1 hypothetical protein [Actinoallomurus rhizosphaericola]